MRNRRELEKRILGRGHSLNRRARSYDAFRTEGLRKKVEVSRLDEKDSGTPAPAHSPLTALGSRGCTASSVSFLSGSSVKLMLAQPHPGGTLSGEFGPCFSP